MKKDVKATDRLKPVRLTWVTLSTLVLLYSAIMWFGTSDLADWKESFVFTLGFVSIVVYLMGIAGNYFLAFPERNGSFWGCTSCSLAGTFFGTMMLLAVISHFPYKTYVSESEDPTLNLERVYVLGAVTFFNPGEPQEWDLTGRIATTEIDTTLSHTDTPHGLVAEEVKLSCQPFSTSRVTEFLLPVDVQQDVRNYVSLHGPKARWNFTPGPVERDMETLERLEETRLAEIQAIRTGQNTAASSLLEGAIRDYVMDSAIKNFSVQELRNRIVQAYEEDGWIVSDLEVKPKTNNWR